VSSDVSNSTFDPSCAYCGGNQTWQNYQNISESELWALTQSYVWNVCDMFGSQYGYFYGCIIFLILPSSLIMMVLLLLVKLIGTKNLWMLI